MAAFKMQNMKTGKSTTVAAGFGKAGSCQLRGAATSFSHEQAVKIRMSDSAWGAAGMRERLDELHCSEQL